MKKPFAIAIDGPAGAGKSYAARTVARLLGAHCLDTGAMYRAMGLYMLRNGVDPMDQAGVEARCAEAVITVRYEGDSQHTFLMGEDVSGDIRTEECSAAASAVSRVPAVRERLVALQREIAKDQSLVMDGRDIGTKVLPDAPVKIFLTASPQVRARRRYDELTARNEEADYDKVLEDIIARDYQDSHRAVSPLAMAEDAVLVDSSDMTPDEMVQRIMDIAVSRI